MYGKLHVLLRSELHSFFQQLRMLASNRDEFVFIFAKNALHTQGTIRFTTCCIIWLHGSLQIWLPSL